MFDFDLGTDPKSNLKFYVFIFYTFIFLFNTTFILPILIFFTFVLKKIYVVISSNYFDGVLKRCNYISSVLFLADEFIPVKTAAKTSQEITPKITLYCSVGDSNHCP